jgi:hypothetical protein
VAKKALNKFVLSTAAMLLFSVLAFGTEAHAAGNCPPGMEQVKLGSTVTCSPPASSRSNSGIDPKAVEAMKSDRASAALDPKFKSFVKGEWSFPRPTVDEQRKYNLPKGDYCGAAFMTVGGIVMLKGPGGKYRGAMLSFVGPNLPKPKKSVKQKITLTQAPDPAATIQAFSYTNDQIGMGVIDVVVPTIDAALGAMVDRQPFKLEIDGKVVLELSWHSGLMARDKLRNCVIGK